MGFWKNNSPRYVTSTTYVALRTWLRTFPPFQDLTDNAHLSAVHQYIKGVMTNANGGGTALNAMLKGQMLATTLNVYFSDPARLSGTGVAPIPTNGNGPIGDLDIDLTHICPMVDSGHGGMCSGMYEDVGPAFGGATHLTVAAMLTYAGSQANAGGTLWYGNVQAIQQLAKDAFDAINNQAAFRYGP
jgi:hypothetical protein